jgi:hypothetical protein
VSFGIESGLKEAIVESVEVFARLAVLGEDRLAVGGEGEDGSSLVGCVTRGIDREALAMAVALGDGEGNARAGLADPLALSSYVARTSDRVPRTLARKRRGENTTGSSRVRCHDEIACTASLRLG